ncbi:hypothetical protein AB832_02775, partial [Flavobacteriaceae bacterium (ex Bugula neritina AB1)]
GTLMRYHKNNQIKSKVPYNRGRKEGIERSFYDRGEKNTIRTFSKGVKIGIHRGWWRDGTPKFQYHFDEQGNYNGSVKEWYRNGQLFKIFNYIHGKESGKQQMYKPSGAIRANYEVINGERYGLIGLKKCYTVKKDSTKIY